MRVKNNSGRNWILCSFAKLNLIGSTANNRSGKCICAENGLSIRKLENTQNIRHKFKLEKLLKGNWV